MNFVSKTLVAAGLVASVAAVSSPAHAVAITETFATSGGTTAATFSPSGSLASATSLNPGGGYTLSNVVGPAGVNGDVLYFTSQNYTLNQTGSFQGGTFGTVGLATGAQVSWDNVYFFTPSSATYTASGSGNTGAINLFLVGTFTDTSNVYNTQSASFVETFTQAGNSAVSFGANFSTPSALTPVPEPVSMSILGLGLLGLAAAKRRRA